ncbi:hypothetical protein D187_006204 [Cystobacter fuscus DSM 2262]|uniref:Uncharacterized protein n=1 Tax=Cystobacter fuscus (strain ATCC 25194 / DSM 2262 / NBRC 100088 / M29) TaxID=1242864 RepID=S9NZ36_CYSF2|nr:hypothetical protein D187_006204 [Cystobacter fuscus DSM 2262]
MASSSVLTTSHDSILFQIDNNVFHHALYRAHASGSINP